MKFATSPSGNPLCLIKRKDMSYKSDHRWLVAGFSSITLGIISSTIYDFIKSKPILSSLVSFSKIIWNFIVRVLESEIKLWWVIFVIFFYKVIVVSFRKYKKDILPETPVYSNYKKENFKNWLWKWDWKWNGEKWKISNLYPYCPKCDIELLDKSDIIHQKIVCPRCCDQYTVFDRNVDDIENVRALIYDNVAKNNY